MNGILNTTKTASKCAKTFADTCRLHFGSKGLHAQLSLCCIYCFR